MSKGTVARTHRTTVELDLDALGRAKVLLGTTTIKDTVDGALHEVARIAALRKAAKLVRSGGLRDLNIARVDDLPKLRPVRR